MPSAAPDPRKPSIFVVSDEVTEALPAERFAWTRVSADTVADELWAASHKGVKEIELTTLDVYHAATYYCHILDA